MAKSDGSQSGGGLIGGIIGATIGFFIGGGIGGAIKGFVYGSTIGGILAPPSGPDIVGPRLEDLSIQTSSNVADLPRFDGTMGMYGNMIWAKENKLQEVITTTTKKKKLLGFTVSKVKTTTYTYYLNCAIAFALMDEEDNCVLLKVWIGDKLVLNRTVDDVGTILAGSNFDDYHTFYPGKDDPLIQPIDPEIAEDIGLANASAYPGVCYMVIRDLDLSPWGDSPSRAQIKVELSSGEVTESDLDFLSQTEVPLHPQYVSNWDANYFDVDGMHVWKWGSKIAEEEELADTTWAPYSPYDFDRLHYISVPGGGTYLKDKFTDIVPREYIRNAVAADTYEQKGLRHTAKGKSDINAAVFVTAFSKPSGEGDGGGSYPNPIYNRGRVVWYGGPSGGTGCSGGGPGNEDEYPSFWEAVQAVIDDVYTCPGTSDEPEWVYDPANQDLIPGGIMWNDGAGAGEGFFRWSVRSEDSSVWYPPIDGAGSIFSGYPYVSTFSIMVVIPGSSTEYIIGTNLLMAKAESHYAIYKGRFYWGATLGDSARIYEIGTDGLVVNSHTISGINDSNFLSGTNEVELVRMGVLNDQLVIILKQGVQARMRIYDTLDIGDFSSYTDYHSEDIRDAFGFTDDDFLNNVSMDYNNFVYYDEPNVYKKTYIDAVPILLGNASPEFIDGAEEPDFFNMWIRGNLLAVSTFGTSSFGWPMPQTGIQFFTIGLIASPGMALLEDILRKYSVLAGIPDERINTSLIHQEVRGHRVAKRGSVRNVIEQLRGCWPFDIVPRGYSLWYVPRGTSPIATISYEDLGPDVQWIQDREMTSQIPWRLSLRYLDRDLEYEINEQQSQRPLDSSTEHTLEIPVVFTPDEAAQRINILHSIFLTERKTFSGFQLPPPYRYLETADVITVVFPDASYQVRLTNLKTASSGLINGEGKPNAPEIYTSSATGSTRAPPVQTIPVAGAAITLLMDLPVYDSDTGPGFTVVMASVYENWTGGILYRTTDQGASWTQVAAFSGACTFGICSNALDAHGGHLIDRLSTLAVQIYAGGTPATVTELEMMNEETLVAYGQHGRWEIMAYQNAVEDSNGYVVFDTFLRGLRGTEWATGLHQPNDYFVLLTDDDNAFIPVQETDVGDVLTYRGVSIGAAFESQFNSTLDYQGENLLPRSPADAWAKSLGANVLIEWSRRDREEWAWEDSFDIIMSEATESYELKIQNDLNSITYRTVTITDPSYEYDYDDILTDFGSIPDEIGVSIRQLSAIVGLGRDLTTVVPIMGLVSPPDPYFTMVVLLVSFDGADNSTAITDDSNSGHVFTVAGSADIDAVTPGFVNQCGLIVAGTGSYWEAADSTDWYLEGGEFTMEVTYMPTTIGTRQLLFGQGNSGATDTRILFEITAAGKFRFFTGSAGTQISVTGTTTLVAGTIYKLAVDKATVSGTSTVYIYVNGVVDGSAVTAVTMSDFAGVFRIGRAGLFATLNADGRFDELRFTKGIGRYRGVNYTPLTGAFPRF